MEKLFNLLEMSPVLSIVLGFLLAVLLVVILREQIKDLFMKKFDLYTKKDIVRAVSIVDMETFNSRGLYVSLEDRVLNNLKRVG